MQEEYIHMYGYSSMNEKNPDQYWQLLLQICNSSRMFIANGVSLYANIDDFTRRKYNRNIGIGFVLLSKGICDTWQSYNVMQH